MPSVSIPVSGGLVTSRDASLLAEGELQRAEDCEYQANDPAAWKVSGRQSANATAESSDISGLAYLEFDGAADKLIAHVDSSYRISAATPSGLIFSDLYTGLRGGTTLDSAYWQNKYYLFNGADRGVQVSSDGTTLTHGMTAITSTGGQLVLLGAGSITLSTGNTLTYWFEERVKDSSGNILKRCASTSGGTFTWTGTGTTDTVRLKNPITGGNTYTPVNADATHVALFRTATNSSFPIGAQVAEVSIASGDLLDDLTVGTDPPIPPGVIYETWAASIDGATIITARAGAPPTTPSTAEMFEDSLVLNDASDLSKIWFSWPGEPHKFPVENYVDFPKSDEVKCIKRLGNVLIVLLRDSVWRMAFLPRPQDAEFSRGRVKEEVEGAHGAVGPLSAALYSYGDGLKLAYISRYGLLTTDGDQWDVLSADLKWERTFNLQQLGQAVLMDNPAKFRLEMYAPSLGSNVNDVCYFFHYHPSHIKADGPSFRAKVTGPIHRPAQCAEVAHIGGRDYLFTGAADGHVYLNDAGAVEPLGSLGMYITTGDKYLGGVGGHAKISSLFVHHPAHPGQQAVLAHTEVNSGYDPATEFRSIDLSRREPTLMGELGLGEAFQLSFSNNDTVGPVACNYFVAGIESLGSSEES